MTTMKCALCLAASTIDPSTVVHIAETQIGPVPTCGFHVAQALADIGYTRPTGDSPVVDFLEQVDPKELQDAALERISDYGDTGGTGAAFLAVLIESAKAQAAG